MGGSSTKTDCPEDNRSVNITVSKGDFNIHMHRPSFYLDSGRRSLPSEPKMALDYSGGFSSSSSRALELPGGSGGRDIMNIHRK